MYLTMYLTNIYLNNMYLDIDNDFPHEYCLQPPLFKTLLTTAVNIVGVACLRTHF